LRVLDNHEDAMEWMQNNGGDYIDVRKGEDKKCAIIVVHVSFATIIKNKSNKKLLKRRYDNEKRASISNQDA